MKESVLHLCGKVLVAGGYRGSFCEKLLKASILCPIEPMPDGFEMDLLLAKAISNSGSASGITYLRRRNKRSGQLQLERGVESM